jgi:histidine ammonia-lyase
MVANLERILGVELLCAAQGIEFRAPLSTSAPLEAVLNRLRAHVPPLTEDRYMAPDLEAAAVLVRGAAVVEAAGMPMPELRA